MYPFSFSTDTVTLLQLHLESQLPGFSLCFLNTGVANVLGLQSLPVTADAPASFPELVLCSCGSQAPGDKLNFSLHSEALSCV